MEPDKETFNPEIFNELFSRYELSECSNCTNQQEVLRTVEFVLQRAVSMSKRIAAVKEAVR